MRRKQAVPLINFSGRVVDFQGAHQNMGEYPGMHLI
jgi:hypothetical protein